MSHRIQIGIDPSINSTGVCVRDTEKNETTYYIIAAKITKKQAALDSEKIIYIDYGKQKPDKNDDFEVREHKKTHNICSIAEEIRQIVDDWTTAYGDVQCVIEGISYGSSSSSVLSDLSGLNYVIRFMFKDLDVPYQIVAPSQLKKFAVGKGNADKDMMTDGWRKCDPSAVEIDGVKVDDVADAYFLSVYQED